MIIARFVYSAAMCLALCSTIATGQSGPPQVPVPPINSPGNRETTFISDVDGWSLYVDHTLMNGCYITRVHNSVMVRLGVDQVNQRIFIAFFSERWRSLRRGLTYPLSFRIDQNNEWSGDAGFVTVGGMNGLRLGIDDGDLLDEFRLGTNLRLSTRDRFIADFPLVGSRRAVAALSICHDTLTEGGDPFEGQGGQQTDPFGT